MWNKLEDCYFEIIFFIECGVFEIQSNFTLWYIYVFHMPEDDVLRKAFFNMIARAPTVFTDCYILLKYIRKDSYLNHKFWLASKLF